MATHDRYFLDRVCSDIFSIEPGGSVVHHPGGWTAYRREILLRQQPANREAVVDSITAQRRTQQRTKLTYNDQRDLKELTRRIPKLEKEKAKLAESLDRASGDYEKTVDLSDQLASIITELDSAETRWLELTEEAERLKG